MTSLREAAQQALEAMSSFESGTGGLYEGEFSAEIAALRAALAEPMKPLAEWQINDLMADIDPEDVCSWSFRQGVYAAEKHHGVRP